VRLVAVAVALALLAVGCGGEERANAPNATATAPAADRPGAPRIEGTSLDGEPVSLAEYDGRPVLVNVWSSW